MHTYKHTKIIRIWWVIYINNNIRGQKAWWPVSWDLCLWSRGRLYIFNNKWVLLEDTHLMKWSCQLKWVCSAELTFLFFLLLIIPPICHLLPYPSCHEPFFPFSLLPLGWRWCSSPGCYSSGCARLYPLLVDIRYCTPLPLFFFLFSALLSLFSSLSLFCLVCLCLQKNVVERV